MGTRVLQPTVVVVMTINSPSSPPLQTNRMTIVNMALWTRKCVDLLVAGELLKERNGKVGVALERREGGHGLRTKRINNTPLFYSSSIQTDAINLQLL